MRFGAKMLIGVIAAGLMAGCTGSTAVSTQPSQAEIDAARARRLADIDKLQIDEAAKERMRAQVRGSSSDPNRK